MSYLGMPPEYMSYSQSPLFTAVGGESTIPLDVVSPYSILVRNGILLHSPSDWKINSSNQIDLVSHTAVAGDQYSLINLGSFKIADTYPKSLADKTFLPIIPGDNSADTIVGIKKDPKTENITAVMGDGSTQLFQQNNQNLIITPDSAISGDGSSSTPYILSPPNFDNISNIFIFKLYDPLQFILNIPPVTPNAPNKIEIYCDLISVSNYSKIINNSGYVISIDSISISKYTYIPIKGDIISYNNLGSSSLKKLTLIKYNSTTWHLVLY